VNIVGAGLVSALMKIFKKLLIDRKPLLKKYALRYRGFRIGGIMQLSEEQVKKVLTNDYAFNKLSLSMMLTRLKTSYANDKSSATLNKCATEINTYLGKFKLMLGADLDILNKI
jgi:hypothetical protein